MSTPFNRLNTGTVELITSASDPDPYFMVLHESGSVFKILGFQVLERKKYRTYPKHFNKLKLFSVKIIQIRLFKKFYGVDLANFTGQPQIFIKRKNISFQFYRTR